MEPGTTLNPETAREAELRRQLQQAYHHLSEITSRLLLANEAIETTLSTDDRLELAGRFLKVVASGFDVRRGAVFLADGDELSVGATMGLDEDEVDELSSSEADMESCRQVMASRRMWVKDPDLVGEDVEPEEEGVEDEEAAEAENGEEEEEEEEEGEEAAGEEGKGQAAGGEGEDEEEEDEQEGDAHFGLYLPVAVQDHTVAILALGERAGGVPFQGEELVLVRHLLSQFALALQRCALLERDAEQLRERDALLQVSREITSTLNLDSVLRSVVNTVGAVVENDRAAIVLAKGDRLILRAVSGLPHLDPDQVELFKLRRPLEYLKLSPARLQISADDLESGERPKGSDVFSEYFSSQEMRSFMAIPLKDDQGLLGFLCLESRQDSWSIKPAEGDALDILAGQTTVAIRNAHLYSEIPLRGISLPMARARGQLAGLDARSRARLAAVGLGALVVALLPVVPQRAGGPTEVRAVLVQNARARDEGVVARVFVHGGERVRQGERLAELEDLELAGRLAGLKGQIEVLRRAVASARRDGDQAAWHSGEIRLEVLERSLDLEERRARAMVLVAPFDGQILELDLDQRIGQRLDAGETFCTIAALGAMGADIEVSEERIGTVRVGQPVALKVVAYPTRSFRGRVTEIGWRARLDRHGAARFLVRARFENPDGALRPGMTGTGKALVGRRSLAALGLEPIVRAFQMGWW